MIVDSSVIVSFLRREPEWPAFARTLAKAETRLLSAGTWIELGAVTSREADDEVSLKLSHLMNRLRIDVVPVTTEQASIGHQAYRRFGKGHHKACLNFGDCFSYALAKETGFPLLFKGNDFIHTDVIPAL